MILNKLFVFSVILGLVSSCGQESGGIDFGDEGFIAKSLQNRSPFHLRRKREATISDRKACNDVANPPKTRVNTGQRLEDLRAKLSALGLSAFLIPSGDSHQSEYTALADKRRQWIGGFKGSSGFAVVTLEKAAMWTDGRYFLQAEDELDCNWLFMKGQEDDDAAWFTWLSKQMSQGAKIGADPSLTGALTWLEWEEFFRKDSKNLTLEPIIQNPIDDIWYDRPARPKDELEVHNIKFSGLSWQEKIDKLRTELMENQFDSMVITALDEIAWLFNLRGNDVPYTPVFRAYAVVDMNQVLLYLPPEKQSVNVKRHLESEDCNQKNCVKIQDYEAIFEDLPRLQNDWKQVLLGKKQAYTGGASFAVFGLIPESKRKLALSPIMLTKAQKNEVEIQGMKTSSLRDAVALIEFADILERGMKSRVDWDELKAAKKLKQLRQEQKHNRGLSFPSISAYGKNGAVIHYKPNNVTNTKIGYDAFYLLDSGGQYLDGTTDVTRTFHYGTPKPFEIEVYTRVLMGAIDLARATFLDGTPDTRLDILARWNLFKVGLNYRHGTGHGIGSYGFIHESPIQVRVYSSEEHPMREGYFFSDEPGYYETDMGGVRLETILQTVKKTDALYQEKNYGNFLAFEPVTLVPFEPHLIDYNLLSEDQINWLNYYNRLTREKVGAELKKQEKTSALKWMMERTEPITQRQPRCERSYSSVSKAASYDVGIFLCILICFYLGQL